MKFRLKENFNFPFMETASITVDMSRSFYQGWKFEHVAGSHIQLRTPNNVQYIVPYHNIAYIEEKYVEADTDGQRRGPGRPRKQ